MARGLSRSLLTSSRPCTAASAEVTIGHVQLRDVVICPHERGILCYPQNKCIVEHDLLGPSNQTRKIADLSFIANSLSSLVLPNTGETLLAAGGQDAELHLSLYNPPPSTNSYTSHYPEHEQSVAYRDTPQNFGRQRWRSEILLEQASINNSVHLTSLNLSKSHESSVEPRVVVSNNDRTVKFFDVSLRAKTSDPALPRLTLAGQLRLDVPVNHCSALLTTVQSASISPDGRTLLSVGDSPDVFLHRISGGSRITFAPMTKLSLSPYISTSASMINSHTSYGASPIPASFSTAFSANGSKFAVASQEGVVVVWDVRSTKPLKVIQTDKTRGSNSSSMNAGSGNGNGNASGWLFDTPWDWSRATGKAPGWGVRSVKFSPLGVGQEVMAFTEHTSLLHVIDARTFEAHEIVYMPDFDSPVPRVSSSRPRSSSPVLRGSTPTSASGSIVNENAGILPPPPSRMLLFSGAVEDTFRIPLSDSARTRRRLGRRMRASTASSSGTADDEVEGIVMIPTLGDREVDNGVRRLLGAPSSSMNIPSNTLMEVDEDERELRRRLEDEDEDMDVDEMDELEADCISSHSPSRASSPNPAASSSNTTPIMTTTPTSSMRLPPSQDPSSSGGGRSATSYRRDSASFVPYSSRPMVRRHRRGVYSEGGNNDLTAAIESSGDVDLDIAGMCFDPSGEFIYVGATKGLCEWKIKGAEKSWWIDSSLR
ncbi:hypothetical protein C8Q75DRAFT_793057 [Abortiporus biennis]|nr:hypothetical protein C8Q75DRAFT_793057 [Abortiporus biennis]